MKLNVVKTGVLLGCSVLLLSGVAIAQDSRPSEPQKQRYSPTFGGQPKKDGKKLTKDHCEKAIDTEDGSFTYSESCNETRSSMRTQCDTNKTDWENYCKQISTAEKKLKASCLDSKDWEGKLVKCAPDVTTEVNCGCKCVADSGAMAEITDADIDQALATFDAGTLDMLIGSFMGENH